jgi:hypothetical protein
VKEITTSSWTLSQCKSTYAPLNATAALVETVWTSVKSSVDKMVGDPSTFYKDACGDGKAKVDADKAWLCVLAAVQGAQMMFGCNKDTNCTKNPDLACESYSAMMTAVCNLTADEVKAKVDDTKTASNCKNKADGGLDFAPPAAAATTSPSTTPNPAASSGSSPMWALALAACLVAGAPAVSPRRRRHRVPHPLSLRLPLQRPLRLPVPPPQRRCRLPVCLPPSFVASASSSSSFSSAWASRSRSRRLARGRPPSIEFPAPTLVGP